MKLLKRLQDQKFDHAIDMGDMELAYENITESHIYVTRMENNDLMIDICTRGGYYATLIVRESEDAKPEHRETITAMNFKSNTLVIIAGIYVGRFDDIFEALGEDLLTICATEELPMEPRDNDGFYQLIGRYYRPVSKRDNHRLRIPLRDPNREDADYYSDIDISAYGIKKADEDAISLVNQISAYFSRVNVTYYSAKKYRSQPILRLEYPMELRADQVVAITTAVNDIYSILGTNDVIYDLTKFINDAMNINPIHREIAKRKKGAIIPMHYYRGYSDDIMDDYFE